MLQNKTFSGQPVFSQLVGLINKQAFNRLAESRCADRYTKKCGAWEHLVAMLYCVMSNCTSLREVTQGLAAYGDKLNHLGLDYTPPRSTLSDANARRDESFFGAAYAKLYASCSGLLSDSHAGNELLRRTFLIDSTTISLFKAILKCAGRTPANGKSKGGIKVHTMIGAYDLLPQLVHFTEAAAHDSCLLSRIKLGPGQIAVFDRAYVDYARYALWTGDGALFVTRLKATPHTSIWRR
ncbi:hypothetical protein BH09BAC1_BH09BAC1_26610 [soil metagenome]